MDFARGGFPTLHRPVVTPFAFGGMESFQSPTELEPLRRDRRARRKDTDNEQYHRPTRPNLVMPSTRPILPVISRQCFHAVSQKMPLRILLHDLPRLLPGRLSL